FGVGACELLLVRDLDWIEHAALLDHVRLLSGAPARGTGSQRTSSSRRLRSARPPVNGGRVHRETWHLLQRGAVRNGGSGGRGAAPGRWCSGAGASVRGARDRGPGSA